MRDLLFSCLALSLSTFKQHLFCSLHICIQFCYALCIIILALISQKHEFVCVCVCLCWCSCIVLGNFHPSHFLLHFSMRFIYRDFEYYNYCSFSLLTSLTLWVCLQINPICFSCSGCLLMKTFLNCDGVPHLFDIIICFM